MTYIQLIHRIFFFINPYSKFKDLDAVETKLSKFQMPKCITLKKSILCSDDLPYTYILTVMEEMHLYLKQPFKTTKIISRADIKLIHIGTVIVFK